MVEPNMDLSYSQAEQARIGTRLPFKCTPLDEINLQNTQGSS